MFKDSKMLELTISMVTALLGLSYPLFIDLINKINEKYNSRRISEKFKNEIIYKVFNYLMIACIVELFTLPAILLYTGSPKLDIYLITFHSICVFILCMCMICLYKLILIYLDPIKLLNFIRDSDESPRDKFEDIIEILQSASSDTTNSELYNSCESDLIEHIMHFQQQELKMREDHENTHNREPYYYPEYIVNALHRIVTLSTNGDHPLLSRGTTIINVLFNQYNDYPITDQVYNIIWRWINMMADKKEEDWLRMYWGAASQFFSFKLKYTNDKKAQVKFIEFHTMVGVLLLHKECYVALKHALFFTNSMPANYPLIQNTFISIFNHYKTLSKSNENMYLIKYQMSNIFEGAGDEIKIESLLLKYCSLLMIRLWSVNDYNITYSDPLAHPSPGNTIQENNHIITIIKIMKNNVNDISNELITTLSLKEDGKAKAIKLLSEYEVECNEKNNKIEYDPRVDQNKIKGIKEKLIKEAHNINFNIQELSTENRDIKLLILRQEVKLDKHSILSGYDYISSNLEEVLITSLLHQLYYNYRIQFLMNSAIFSTTIPYIDMGKALESLKIDNRYAIIAMGVNTPFYSETKGFYCDNNNQYLYKGSNVYQIPASDPSIVIMKANELPFFKLYNNAVLDNMPLIDNDTCLYSNIDNLSKEDCILKVAQCYRFYIPKKLRYIRIKISYDLTSDSMLLNKVQSINNYFEV